MQLSFTEKKNIRKSFGKLKESLSIPNLIEVQKNSYRELTDYSILNVNPNTNFNLWNLDLNFEWWFAPGSNLVFLYRNQNIKRNRLTKLANF